VEAALQLLAEREKVADGHVAALAAGQQLEVSFRSVRAGRLRLDSQTLPLLVDLDCPPPVAPSQVSGGRRS